MVFLLALSRSRRRSATVTSSQPDASRAASIASSLVYLPVPRNRRERSVTPATTRGSACVTVCTGSAYGGVPDDKSPPGGFAADLPSEWGGEVPAGQVPTRRLLRRTPQRVVGR